jgi:phosphate transport system permease protein
LHQKPSGARRLLDRAAGLCVRASGITIIINIFLIFILIVTATLPLWRPATVEIRNRFAASSILNRDASGRIMAIGCEEHRRLGYVLGESGMFSFFTLKDGREHSRFQAAGLAPARISSVWRSPNGAKIAAGTDDGRVFIGSIDFSPMHTDTGYSFSPSISFSPAVVLDLQRRSLRCITMAGSIDGRMFVAGITSDGRVVSYAQRVQQNSRGELESKAVRQHLPVVAALPSQVAINDSFEDFFVGSDDGTLLHYRLEATDSLSHAESVRTGDHRITSLLFLAGGHSLVVGDAEGNTGVYASVPDAETRLGRRLRRIHDLPPLDGSIVLQAASMRNRTFLAACATGEIGLFFSTNERVLFRSHLFEAPLALAIFSPKADGLLLMDVMQTIYDLTFRNPHPEANLKAFFQKIWYEGHERPDFAWQSSGPDDFEPKLSLIPLIFGTLKGTLYAMLFSLPLAVGAALYVSQFMHHWLRGVFKPAIEMMAMLPSVVLGFLAALWLAPLLERIFPAVLLMVIFLPLMIALFSLAWIPAGRLIPRMRIANGKETLVILPLLAGGIWLCLQLNGALESRFFGGNFKQWLIEFADLAYDQRNAFVVGAAMAFAVIPAIFTIAEEALSNVPARLTAASLALGATPWQTALRIILPTASPGILAAVMIGFGRAVGETMIVLMATGNTPIVDLSILNGFRTLAANIAVEMPEAPAGGTLFRALFLAALLLFLMTFLTNTIAELVRQRQRDRYGKL